MSKLQFMQRAASLPGPETNAPAAAAATSAVQPPPAPPQLELQIVAMSATLPNLEEVAGWMDATLFHTDFRPVALQDSYKLGDNLYDPRGRLLRQLPPCAQTGRGPQQDPDRVVTLVEEACLKGDQVGWWMCCAVLCCTLRGSLISDNPSIVTFCSPSTHPHSARRCWSSATTASTASPAPSSSPTTCATPSSRPRASLASPSPWMSCRPSAAG